MSWFDHTYRKLFFDFHTPETAGAVGSQFDAKAWARQLREVGAQAVSAFAKCGYGWSFYDKCKVGWRHPNLRPGLDMLGETIEACHEEGIRVIAYYHTFNSQPIARLHPDWVRLDKEGRPQGINICLLGPLAWEHFIPQVEEIARNYPIDGIFFDGTYAAAPCYCPHCQERFRRETSQEKIPLGPEEPGWGIYVRWALDAYSKLRSNVTNAVHRYRPSALVSFNWVYTLRLPEVPPKELGFLSLDIGPDNQVFNGSYQAKYWSTLHRPFDIMNSAFLQWWGDWGVKPALTMQQECATIIANGGKTWIGYQMEPRGQVEPAIMKEFGSVFQFVREREELCRGAEAVPYIGVLHSAFSNLTKGPRFFADESAAQGAHKILLEGGFHYNIFNEEGLMENLDSLRAVILPDQRYIKPELADALRRYVEMGGALVATYRTGTLDDDMRDTGTFVLEDLFGVEFAGEYPYSHGYISVEDASLKADLLDMPFLIWSKFLNVSPGGVTPSQASPSKATSLARLWLPYLRTDGKFLFDRGDAASPLGAIADSPAMVVNGFGAGKVVYIAGEIFSAYIQRNQWLIKRLVKNILNSLIPENARLVELDGPGACEVVLTKKGNRLIVHLINHLGERPIGRNNALTEGIFPMHDLTLKLRGVGKPIRVVEMPGERELSWSMNDGTLAISLPRLDIHCAVVVDAQ